METKTSVKKGFSFSKRSLTNLGQCHPDLQRLAKEVIKEIDIVVICGHRNKADQEAAFKKGTSKLHFPKSKHNSMPARAYDACPMVEGKINWEARAQFLKMREITQKCADRLGIKVRFISWDLPHVELA